MLGNFPARCLNVWHLLCLCRVLQDCHIVLVLLPLVRMAVNMSLHLEVMLLRTATSQAAVLSCQSLFTLSRSLRVHLVVKKVTIQLLPHTPTTVIILILGPYEHLQSFSLLFSLKMWATLKKNQCSGVVQAAWTSLMFLSHWNLILWVLRATKVPNVDSVRSYYHKSRHGVPAVLFEVEICR